jgi:phosphotriesterase-related protein
MKAMTVRGPVDVEELGFTLPHEHLMFTSEMFFAESRDAWTAGLADQPVSLENVGELRRAPMVCRDNLVLNDEEVAVKELAMFREAGGSTIVHVSDIGLRHKPIGGRPSIETVKRLSERTGVNVVAGTGYYQAFTHPSYVASSSVDELAQVMIGELNEGIDGTDIRAGIMGEIGISEGGMGPDEVSGGGMHPDEEKVLRACALAQIETGAAISMHNAIPLEHQGFRVLNVLRRAGADLTRVIMGHMTQSVPDIVYHRALADTGAVLEFDRCGAEFYNDGWGGENYCEQRDAEVAEEVAELVRLGYADRIMLSHDIGFKIQLSSYGGLGYAHIPRRFVRYLANLGVSPEQIHQITVLNPARLLGNERLGPSHLVSEERAGATA